MVFENSGPSEIDTSSAQKMKFSITEIFSKCDQIRRKLRIWSHLLNKSVMENFIFCAVFFNVRRLFTITIVGDSMVKSIHGRAYSDNENNVFIKSILGVKTKFMKSYIMPTVELELEVIAIHRSTKNLKQIMTPEAIPCETIVMGTSAKIYIRHHYT